MDDQEGIVIGREGVQEIVVEGNTKVLVKDAIVVAQGGRVVWRLDAVFDFEEVPEEHHGWALSLIESRRVRLDLPLDGEIRESREIMVRYRQRKEEWNKLPWWRKAITKRPEP